MHQEEDFSLQRLVELSGGGGTSPVVPSFIILESPWFVTRCFILLLSFSEDGADPNGKPPAERGDAAQEVTDVEGVHLEERAPETCQGEDSELSLSFQGYVAELRQCQSKMRSSQTPHNGRNAADDADCNADLFKATVV